MRRVVLHFLLLSALAVPAQASSSGSRTPGGVPDLVPVADGEGSVVTSSSAILQSGAARAATDTFAIYGGPDHPTQGKFQLEDAATPDWGGGSGLPGGIYGGGPEAWTPVDLTELPVFWHVDTFNAENLNSHGPGNRAMWSGLPADDPRTGTWVHRPGYGNNWFDILIYESDPVSDPSVGQTVSLDFWFNHDLEPGFDFFQVQYDSAGDWTTVLAVDGTNADSLGTFPAPGVRYTSVASRSITYGPFGYDLSADRIRIRLVVESDGAWSDEDGLWPTRAGAAQVDDISLVTSEGGFFEDFEGPGPYLFRGDQAPFAGDFADLYPGFSDPDPCRYSDSPVVGFLDYDQIVRNGPGINGAVRTGGSTTAGIDYGIPGNWVTNYSGGLSFGTVSLTNEIWSPDIAWDLPGPEDDDVSVSGAFFRFSVWNHLRLIDGVFFVWWVRSALPGEDYTGWSSRNFLYHGGNVGEWQNQRFDVSDLIQAGAERVQISLGAWDYASVFGFPGNAATPSPIFDNVAFYKYRIAGPNHATRTIDLANDGFPVSGSIDVSTPASRDALDVAFDMARDVNTGDVIIDPGDSVVVDVTSTIPGADVTDIRMVWALATNPVFEDAIRAAPARPKDQNVVAGPAGTVWTGEVVADSARTQSQFVVKDKYFVDLPDQDFLYPGDVLHYYIQSTDSDGRASTLPSDVSGFDDFTPQTVFDRTFTVRALPSIRDAAGTQPLILVINDFGRRGGEAEFTSAFTEFGFEEGVDYDTYTVQGPSSLVGNGIGSAGAHGATADQLEGYEHLMYLAGDLSDGLLSSRQFEKEDDIGLLEQWHDLPGTRNMAYFGDNIASGLAFGTPESFNYLVNTMGVDLLDSDVRPVIGGQTSPLITPTQEGTPWFRSDFVIYGGCVGIRTFDQILPLGAAYAGHQFTDTGGAPIAPIQSGAASVIHPTPSGYEITFPFSLVTVRHPLSRAVSTSARTVLLESVLALFNYPVPICDPYPCTDAPPVRTVELQVAPNPFNPSTVVEFTAAPGSRGSVRIYNLRGELVRTLHRGEFRGQRFLWDGTDDRGAAVASGVYVVQAEDGITRMTEKIALVK